MPTAQYMPDAPEARPKRPIRSVIPAGSARSDARCQPRVPHSRPVTRWLAPHVAKGRGHDDRGAATCPERGSTHTITSPNCGISDGSAGYRRQFLVGAVSNDPA